MPKGHDWKRLRRIVLAACAVLLAGALGFAAFAVWQFVSIASGPRPTAKDFDANLAEYEGRVQREIPTGSSLAQVEKFLAGHKIDHSGAEEVSWRSVCDTSKLAGDHAALKSCINGIVRDVQQEGIITWSLQVRFFFDERNRLAAHTAEWIGTGP
jgi:hypothetical protein